LNNSVAKAIRILELLASSEKPLTLTQISDELNLAKSTAHGLLRELVAATFLELHEPAAYSIGLRTFEVGAAYLRRTGAVGVIAPELVGLTRTLNVTTHYAVLDGTDAVYLCKEDPPGLGVQLASSIGARLPAEVTAVGKACLAWLHPDAIAEHVRPPGSTDGQGGVPAQLTAELMAVKARGFATDLGEAAAGIECVAAPVFDISGPRGAIGVSYLLGLNKQTDEVAEKVVAVAARVTTLLGGAVPR
jgi:DNA-binding IclR family transcriptional regulator